MKKMEKTKKVLFIDRDGTLIKEPEDFQIDSFEKLDFLPEVIFYLGKIVRETDYELVMVTNQDGLGTPAFPIENFQPVQDLLLRTLESENIRFSDVFVDRTFERDNQPTRKPGTGMLGKYMDGGIYDLENSFVIGDRPTDVQLAENLGAKAIFIETSNFDLLKNAGDCIAVKNWCEIYECLKLPPRRAAHRRQTKETDVEVDLNLDGSGRSEIFTGIPFFDHLLEQIARHASIDLKIKATGDLHIDEHHTMEDVAIALGESFDLALKDKRGMARYGFCLPMDDCLAQVAVDFGGRSWTVWNAEFKREKIGDAPTEMFFHFFKSFADHARCNLNIKAEGVNEHHKIEAIFKAFARAVKMSLQRDPADARLPTTKGLL